ncbi:hypothetical protein B0T10DRAFT_557827 [Thelonectria olida]|uniref:G-protein coupled receptors family 2 profile 2 domain-containing protein n=1 Tax=Thelonectria olida TaxID=1576542 RepID=A0A9P8WEI7_9HYPO|nr:hypothetical protein B0T10DRAFT_557827 [Thelonectria olida]
MAGGYLSKKEVEVLITIERTGAGCSMVAILLTILSYCFVKRLRTTPNLFLLFASIANAGASIASMMGYDGLQKGEDSTLCQSQAFIFEWFMQSDPWWSLAMAVNVFLVFFCNASPSTFRKYAWVYCLVCFGGPLIPAIALISIRDPTKGLIFGDAALWCWIRTDWSLVRLYSYYIPIWFCIFLSIVIYVAVGYQVFHHRNQLRHLAVERRWEKEGTNSSGSRSGSGIRPVSEESLTHRPEFYGTVITEVQVTTDVSKQNCRSEMTIPPNVQLRSPQRARSWALPLDGDVLEGAGEHRGQRVETVCTSNRMPYQQSTVMTRLRAVKSSASMKLKRLDPVKMAYLRTSFIFGFAVLITWIPSSINRLYSLTHDGKISFPFSVASGSVLPLQGVWNAIIYFTTSWSIVKEEFASAKARWLRRDTAPNIRLDSRLGTVGEHRDTFEAHRYPGPARTPSQSGSDAWTRTDSEGQI